ncbi:UvrD-helicase domain-containing protein [Pseudokineococcus sp. 1T1Z-3]|uniref:UvrD-helicase domain-containing protein n=1 Tax=Pseudokineococcus sp. 1T1Z-3 TaxID=3132745 RepID=UPI003098A606
MSADAVDPRPFRVGDALPVGTTLLEASAGTGKTWTIAALVARYVADAGLPVEDLLVMSFSRESTRELRERVRARLVEARDALAPGPGDGGTDSPDELLALLRRGGAQDVALRHRRLSDALASFDAATVTTTHGFCQRVLTTLGAVADHDPRTELVEDLSDVVEEVAVDLYLRKWGVPGAEAPELGAEDFRELVRTVAADPASRLLPDPTDEDVPEVPALRAKVAGVVRSELDRRLRRAGRLGHDQLLLRLAHTLEHPQNGPVARERMRRRYRVVLVDEFQDTDPVQWRVLRAAFHDDGPATSGAAPGPLGLGDGPAAEGGPTACVPRALVLVGDPKQAVYGFRGADVHAYLDAASRAQDVRTLTVNHRTDAAVLRGLDAVLGGAALGDPRIRVRPLDARHGERRLDGAPPVRLRVVSRRDLPLGPDGTARVAGARARVVADVRARVVELLDGPVRSLAPPAGGRSAPEDDDDRAGDDAGGGTRTGRRLEPREVAVLVRTNQQAQLVRSALEDAGVPVVVAGRTSVFGTPAAADWQVLLEALEQPHRTTRVRRLALTPFGGLDLAALDAGGDAVVDDLAQDVRRWARVLDDRGVGALQEAVSWPRRRAGGESTPLAARLLGQVGGERRVTDLRHVGQVLHEESLREGLGLSALLAWLRERREDAGRDGGLERSRRLESDAAAVQVLTVHASKGLEFPAVLVPFAWDRWPGREPSTAVVHDDAGRRCRDVGGRGSPGWREHVREQQQEDADEELRLAYVALTRASSHLLVWWAGSTNTEGAPLHRLLLGRPALADEPGGTPSTLVAVPPDADAFAAMAARAAGTDGALVVEPAPLEAPAAHWSSPPRERRPLAVATLDRDLDDAWRRTSYSALTAAAHDAVHGAGAHGSGSGRVSEPEAVVEDDELGGAAPRGRAGGPDEGAGAPDAGLREVPTHWDGLGAGTRFGLLVHAVLEELDPADLTSAPAAEGRTASGTSPPAGDPALRALVAEQAAVTGTATDVDGLVAALALALATPLGPLAGELALADVAAADRLPELDFELPLAGGDDPTDARPLLSGLVPLWREHCPGGPLAGYADALADLGPAELRGYLSGSVDAVLRVPCTASGTSTAGVAGAGGSAGHRYLVVDYKTNRLGVPDTPLTAWDYRPQALEDAMVAAHYPLQSLLYQVALHRFLRWRLPGYDPARHLGGSLYLFVRGMVGPDVRCADGSPPGVAAWATPPSLVLAASDLLAGRP